MARTGKRANAFKTLLFQAGLTPIDAKLPRPTGAEHHYELHALYRELGGLIDAPVWRPGGWEDVGPADRAVPGALYMPQYRLPQTARAAVLDAQANALYLAGTKAKPNGDKYVLSTVFFAAMLFLAGISLRLLWRPLRLVVLGLAAAMLLLGLGFVVSLPVA